MSNPSTAEGAVPRGRKDGEGSAGALGRWEILALLGLLAAGVASRFFRLGEWGLAGDEYYTLINSRALQRVSLPEALRGAGAENLSGFRAYPVHYLLTSLALDAFGIGPGAYLTDRVPFVLRLVPGLAGALAPAALALAARRMVGFPAAALAGLLLLFSPWHLYHAQNARFYSLVFLLTGLAGLGLYRALREDRAVLAGLSMALLAVAILTHTTAAFLGLGVGGFALLLALSPGLQEGRPFPRRAVAVMAGTVLLAGVAVLPRILEAVKSRGAIGLTAAAYSTAHLGAAIVLNLGPATVLFAGFGLFALARKDRPAAVFLGLASILPAFTLTTLGSFFDARQDYVFACAPFVFLLAGALFAETLASGARWLALSLLGLALVATAPSLASNWSDGNRHDVRAAGLYLRDHARKADYVVGEGHALLEYYSGLRGVHESPPSAEDLAQFAAMARDTGVAVWFVLFYTRNGTLVDGSEDLEAFVHRRCRLAAEIRRPRWDYHENVIRIWRAGSVPER